jgi:hypothetical protein
MSAQIIKVEEYRMIPAEVALTYIARTSGSPTMTGKSSGECVRPQKAGTGHTLSHVVTS